MFYENVLGSKSKKKVHSNILKDVQKLKQFDPLSFMSNIFKKKERKRFNKAQDKI